MQDDPAGSFLYAHFKVLLDLTEKFTDVIQKRLYFCSFFAIISIIWDISLLNDYTGLTIRNTEFFGYESESQKLDGGADN